MSKEEIDKYYPNELTNEILDELWLDMSFTKDYIKHKYEFYKLRDDYYLLQQENKKLNMQLDQALKDYDEEMQKNMKAIEYIKNNSHYYNADGEIMFVIEEENEENFCKDVLEILKGDSNE